MSSGPPHVLRAHTGVHRTCGGPNEIKKNTHPENTIDTALFSVRRSLWEGGVRNHGWIYSPLLETTYGPGTGTGTGSHHYSGLVHVSDWYAHEKER